LLALCVVTFVLLRQCYPCVKRLNSTGIASNPGRMRPGID
jgi:hypothetical protein